MPTRIADVEAPRLNIWNAAALNRSDWMPMDLLCPLRVHTIFVPALPMADRAGYGGVELPYLPPGGLIACLDPHSSLDLNFAAMRPLRFFPWA